MDMDFETFKNKFISLLDHSSTETQKTQQYIFETEDYNKTIKKYGLKNKIFSAKNDKDLFKQLYEYLLTNYNFDLLLELYNDRQRILKEEEEEPKPVCVWKDEEEKRYTPKDYMNIFTDFELHHLGSRLWYKKVAS